MRASETAEMIFENCIIPDENDWVLGDGFVQSMKILDGGRFNAALSQSVPKVLTIHHYYILKNANNLENQLVNFKEFLLN